jgi:hypothetical protein
MANSANPRKPRRLKYRLSFVFLFLLLSFVVAFTMYMKNDEDLKLPGGLFGSGKEAAAPTISDENEDGTPLLIVTTVANGGVKNPVPQSQAAEKSYLADCLFVGSPALTGLSETDIVANNAVIADSLINSENLGNLVVKRGDDNKTVKRIVMDEKIGNIYILLSPETDLDTEALTDFCEDILSNNKSACIYFISALPGQNSGTFNEELLEFANEAGVNYLDFNTAVVGNDGKIAGAYGDGGKLNRDGYIFLSEYILTHIAE